MTLPAITPLANCYQFARRLISKAATMVSPRRPRKSNDKKVDYAAMCDSGDEEASAPDAEAKPERPEGIPKPCGRAPKGATWDYAKGEWIGGAAKPQRPKGILRGPRCRRRYPIGVAALVRAGLPAEEAQLWVDLCAAEQVDIPAETLAQLEVALRAGNREELLRLLRVAHVDAAVAEQALALIAAGGPVGDVAGAAQRLKEVRSAIAYALTHRVKPEIAVASADAVRPKAQEAERKALELREKNREAQTRMRERRKKERATLIVQVAALTGWGDDLQSGVRDLRERLAAIEADVLSLRAAASSDGLQDFRAASLDGSAQLDTPEAASEALIARGRYNTEAAAADALDGNTDAWAALRAPNGVSEGCATVRAAIGRHQAVHDALDDTRRSLERRLTPATPAAPKKRKAAAPAPAPETPATPAATPGPTKKKKKAAAPAPATPATSGAPAS